MVICKHWGCIVNNNTCTGCGTVICRLCLQEPLNCKCDIKDCCCNDDDFPGVLISEITGVDFSYCIPDVIWNRIVPLLIPSSLTHRMKKTGRPRMDDRKAMSAIFYVLRTGCQGKALPSENNLRLDRTESFT